ncbi:MAG: glucosamine-6-phosphate deaminase, partial [Agathobacter sp.]|nr:glucosamine-6-phosphate deaminase [Agathobacter sp.]
MRIIKTADYNEMSKVAGNIIAAQMILKPNCVLGLATGSSPIGTYKELIKKCDNGDIDFSDITTVNLDEYRGLPRTNDQS